MAPAPIIVWILFSVVLLLLLSNTFMELQDITTEMRKFQFLQYITDGFNLIDLGHLLLVWMTLAYFISTQVQIAAFSMQKHYPVLFYGPEYESADKAEPLTKTKVADARVFRTNVQQEYDFLEFNHHIFRLEKDMRTFSLLGGIAFVFFIFRVLKSLNFQGRMGLVTRTIAIAISDLFHFFILYFLNVLAYSYAGYLIFGHQYGGMHTFGHAMSTLFIIIMNFDPRFSHFTDTNFQQQN